MTANNKFAGAPPANAKQWQGLSWPAIRAEVNRLQVRIAKATREGRKGKVKALQRLLTSSFSAKCLAIKRVVKNKGANTPGVDGILWQSDSQRMKAVNTLKRCGYTPKPLRRIYIPKKNQKAEKRPLSIPCMTDRAMQALWKLALEPVAEVWADLNSYGFRPKRSVADAIQQCFCALANRDNAQWIFEGDIKACFDRLSHHWLLEHIPMDKIILRKFLKAGYMEERSLHPTLDGTPQGGIISPTLLVMVLSGLEKMLVTRPRKNKVNFVGYADDFIVTADTKECLENKVIPKVITFLKERGLEISPEKSKITHIEEGFRFLGHNIRKYDSKMLIKPAKENVHGFLREIRKTIKSKAAAKTEVLIHQLNPKIRGWCNFYRHVVSKRTFSYIDKEIYKALDRWIKRRHPTKRKTWRNRKYFRRSGFRNWQFYAAIKGKDPKVTYLDLLKAKDTRIQRHIKIRNQASPYDPNFNEYFEKRNRSRKTLPGMKVRGINRMAG